METLRRWGLLGIPDHQGVMNVGGRVGAAQGPAAFREAFARLRGGAPVQAKLQDLGNIAPLGTDIKINHSKAAQAIEAAHRNLDLTVIVGGGHDHGYSHLLGIFESLKKGKKAPRLGCINIDAHLDVRKPAPSITSGSPFYLALEAGILEGPRLVEFGIQSHCNGDELWAYVRKRKAQIIPFHRVRNGKAVNAFHAALRSLASRCDVICLSLDLDSACEAFAPGVSSPQAEGFTSSELVQICELAGAQRRVASLGIFELCPIHDIEGRTARLAATCAYHFVEKALSRK